MPGDCHYLVGNANARRRIERIKFLLAEIGLEPERVEMFNMSSAMAGEFARVANDMTARVESMGINPLRRKDEGGRK
jgi:coenzyme F420-reducing hydrogenase delta subunit